MSEENQEGIKPNRWLLIGIWSTVVALFGFMGLLVYLAATAPDLKQYIADTDSCKRPFAVSVYNGHYSAHYFCRSVSEKTGENCLERSWYYFEDKGPQHKKHDYRQVYWSGATVETTVVPECNPIP